MSKLADELEALGKNATEGPWAWDQRGEKVNEWGLGIAMKADEQPYIGHFRDDDAVYVEYVCSHEAATCNYEDPALICALRNNLPEIIAALRVAARQEEKEMARLREIEHAAWHAIEACEERGDHLIIPLDEAVVLTKLLPEAHPGNDEALPSPQATQSEKP